MRRASGAALAILITLLAGAAPIVHHTDAVREWAYDRDSKIGRLDKALDQAPARGWTVVDMKEDWKIVFSAR